MTGWIRIPEDWFATEEIERLPAELVVFHLSALAESCRHMLDGKVTARAIRRIWPVEDTEAVIRELVTAGLWQPIEDGWQIRDWRTFLLSASEVEHRRAQSRETSERYRRHKQGDHSLCDRCAAKRGDASRDASRDASVTSPDPIRSDPKGRKRRGGTAAAPADAGPPAAQVIRPPHKWTDHCCPLPDIHPVHKPLSFDEWLALQQDGGTTMQEIATHLATFPEERRERAWTIAADARDSRASQGLDTGLVGVHAYLMAYVLDMGLDTEKELTR